ncbi:hypothetical protein N0V90_008835 [Kalmusia sp. IMI 367209]|nr:hypothetical protein N0V90_008835 [Kalmusia sp. IMI 367209]
MDPRKSFRLPGPSAPKLDFSDNGTGPWLRLTPVPKKQSDTSQAISSPSSSSPTSSTAVGGSDIFGSSARLVEVQHPADLATAAISTKVDEVAIFHERDEKQESSLGDAL